MITATQVRRHWWIPAGAAALGAAAALALSMTATPSYTAQSSLLFGLGYSGSATDANQGAAYTLTQVPTFAELATSETILDPVRRELGLDDSVARLAGRLEVSTPPGTSVLRISATHPSAGEAAAIANAIAAEVREYVTATAPVDDELGPLYSVSTIDSADAPSRPSSPNTALNIAAGGLAGLLAGIVLAFWRNSTDTRIRTRSDLSSIAPVPVIGAVRNGHGDVPSPDSLARLAARLRHALDADAPSSRATEGPEGGSVVLLTSATSRGGTSALARGLAEALGGRVVGLPDAAGSEIASGETHGLRHAIDESRTSGSIVLVDTPPVASDAAALTLATASDPAADAVVLVVDARHAKGRHVLAALDELNGVGASVLGVVLNRAQAADAPGSTHRDHTPKHDATAARDSLAEPRDEADADTGAGTPERRPAGVFGYFAKTKGGEAGV
ncbi:MAG: hypothetical protein IR160_09335 [Salinibacterium sp.]|nr:hypothetical protein [Salinibacterium sp.]MBF0672773.1 hypothetical protein [Salinibacterium sp.]